MLNCHTLLGLIVLRVIRSTEADAEPCPPELLTPIAIAEHLLDETQLPAAPTPAIDLSENEKSNNTPEDSVESADAVSPS